MKDHYHYNIFAKINDQFIYQFVRYAFMVYKVMQLQQLIIVKLRVSSFC